MVLISFPAPGKDTPTSVQSTIGLAETNRSAILSLGQFTTSNIVYNANKGKLQDQQQPQQGRRVRTQIGGKHVYETCLVIFDEAVIALFGRKLQTFVRDGKVLVLLSNGSLISHSSSPATFTTPKSCRPKRSPPLIVYGGGIGGARAGNTLRVLWCGR